MAYYDNNNNDPSSSSAAAASWSAQNRQPSWEHQQSASQSAPSRSNTSSAMSHQPDFGAFASQFEEIERATDNLMKSGKWFPGQAQAGAQSNPMQSAGPRRESVPNGPQYGADPRMGGGPPPRHHAAGSGEFDAGNRPGSAGLQGFYAGQRFPGGRQSEAEQVLQAKRRMAAQRERELRNYHQEQQYNRTSSGGSSSSTAPKPDRAMSPNTMSEEDRRELIARQHRALYGENSQLYGAEGQGQSNRQSSQDARVPSGGRGASPLAFDPYGAQAQSGAGDGGVQMPPRDRAENTASPASNPPTQQNYNHLSEVQQAGRTSNSSPGGSPPLIQGQKGGVAPIGTRPMQNPGAAKRATTPLTPSSLSYGFSNNDGVKANNGKDERSASAASNANSGGPSEKGVAGLPGWGSNSGVWGSAAALPKKV